MNRRGTESKEKSFYLYFVSWMENHHHKPNLLNYVLLTNLVSDRVSLVLVINDNSNREFGLVISWKYLEQGTNIEP